MLKFSFNLIKNVFRTFSTWIGLTTVSMGVSCLDLKGNDGEIPVSMHLRMHIGMC